jgi:hypothetical protein
MVARVLVRRGPCSLRRTALTGENLERFLNAFEDRLDVRFLSPIAVRMERGAQPAVSAFDFGRTSTAWQP